MLLSVSACMAPGFRGGWFLCTETTQTVFLRATISDDRGRRKFVKTIK